MTFLELVRSRRSLRAYDNNKDIARADLELCVETARHAPSACNSQPWKFILITDREKKEKIARDVFSGLYEMNTFAREAGAFAVLVAENVKFPAWAGAKLMNTDFRRIDIGIACEHFVLQAQELGIGTCILGWFDKKKLKKMLSVPSSKKIELVISMGYPSRPGSPEKKLKGLDEILSFNKY